MENRETARKRAMKFMGEKGFYIVLFVCAAVLGVTAWIISGSLEGLDEADRNEPAVSAAAGLRENPSAPRISPPPAPVLPQPPELSGEALSVPEKTAPAPVPDETPAPSAEPQPPETPQEAPSSAPGLFIMPAAGAVETPHSVEALRYDKTMNDWRTHSGVDIAAALGAKVMAAADGTVESVYSDEMYGSTVVIRHGGGIRTIYSNLAATPVVSEGESVSVGDTVGAIGETALAEIGEVTHLHFEMTCDGAPVDPCDYLPAA